MARVAKLPQESGLSAWDDFSGDSRQFPDLQNDLKCDVLVIGGGFAGLAAARYLNNAGVKDIVVVDALRIGEGAAGRNAGFMIDLPHHLSASDYAGELDKDRKAIEENRFAISFSLNAAHEYGIPDSVIRKSGKINAACTSRSVGYIETYVRHLDNLAEPYRRLNAADMAEITGSQDFYLAGLETPGTVMIQPSAYIKHLARGLSKAGVSIYEQTPVLGITRDNGLAVATANHKIYPSKVILATNGHAQSFGYFRNRFIHITTFASVTSPLSERQCQQLGGTHDWSITPAAPHGTTLRRLSGDVYGGDRLFFRSVFKAMGLSPARAGTLDRIAAKHQQGIAKRFPVLKNIELSHVWSGRLCLSYNGTDAVGEIDKGVYTACCQNGLGTVRGTYNGIRAARCLLGESQNEGEIGKQLPLLPPQRLLNVGVNRYLQWQRWLARQEV